MKAYKIIKNKLWEHLPPFQTAVGRCRLQGSYSAAVALTAGSFGGKEIPPDETAVSSMGRGLRILPPVHIFLINI